MTAFWRRRGVGDEGVARCLAMAQQHPEHRDLASLKCVLPRASAQMLTVD